MVNLKNLKEKTFERYVGNDSLNAVKNLFFRSTEENESTIGKKVITNITYDQRINIGVLIFATMGLAANIMGAIGTGGVLPLVKATATVVSTVGMFILDVKNYCDSIKAKEHNINESRQFISTCIYGFLFLTVTIAGSLAMVHASSILTTVYLGSILILFLGWQAYKCGYFDKIGNRLNQMINSANFEIKRTQTHHNPLLA